MTLAERTLPDTTISEDVVLATILTDPSGFDKCGQLTFDHFRDDLNREVWRAIRDLRHRGDPIDESTVLMELKSSILDSETVWTAIGGATGFAQRYSSPNRALLQWHVAKLHDAYKKRSAIEGFEHIGQELLGANGKPIGDQLDAAIVKLQAIRDTGRNDDDSGSGSRPAEFPSFTRFPTELLPQPIREYVEAGSLAIGCDSSYTALPMLAALGATIGTSRSLIIKPGWTCFPIMWCGIVGESGDQKTPALRHATLPFREIQRRLMEKYRDEVEAWRERSKDKQQSEDDPEPKPSRLIVSDATVESLAIILQDNPCGVCLVRDELSGWMRSFDRYAARGGGDVAAWLSMHSGESLTIDRKTGADRTVFVPHAAAGVVGGFQPGILQRCLFGEHSENGLAARLLLCYPPRRPKRWSDASVAQSIIMKTQDVVSRLVADRCEERVLTLSIEALHEFRSFYDRHSTESMELSGVLASAYSKLEELPARLAIILHCVQGTAATEVCGSTMRSAIELTEWFKAETRRVHGILAETQEQRDCRRLAEWIASRGGAVSVRDCQRGPRWLREPGIAEKLLIELVRLGVGEWEPITPSESGGRPTQRFRLLATGDGAKTTKTRKEKGVMSPSPLVTNENKGAVSPPVGLEEFTI